MTHSELYEKFISQIELEYDGKYIDSDRKSINTLIQLRIRPEKEALIFAMFAVKQWASKAKGLPDCAVIRQSLDKYEAEYQSSLKPKSIEFNQGIPKIDVEKDRLTTPPDKNIYLKAEKMGIDWHKPGWMLEYFNKMIEGKKQGGGYIGSISDLDTIPSLNNHPSTKPITSWEELGNIARSRNPVTTS
jgi:hypothetical protein